jgi:hypothetical protein
MTLKIKIFNLITGMLLLLVCFTQAQMQEITTRYYFSTGDYLNGRLSESEVILVVREMGDDYIYVKDVLEKDIRKHSKNGTKAWAIEYNGNAYLNLMYSYNTKVPQFYVMLDIKGKYCVAIMGQEFLESLKKASPNLVMPGLIGSAAMAAAESWGANFADSTGELKKVLVVDTEEILPITKNSPGEFINRSKLKWFLGQKQLEGKLDEYSVEDILARAEELNGVNSRQGE